MKICSVKIENFKAFNSVEIPLNPKFNVIIGENNIGKSTLFEAIHLWMLGYKSLIQANGKSFYGSNTLRYISFDSLYFLRITNINDVFHSNKKTASITINILLEEKIYSLKIKFEKPASMGFYLRVKYEGQDFKSLSEMLKEKGLNLSNSIFIYHTRPVFSTIKNEPFYNSAQLMKKISLGKTYDVIRNKILKGDPSERKFIRLQQRISKVFNNQVEIRFKNKNLQDEEYVRITVKIDNSKEVDISLVGSGILQIIDIFSTLEFINRRDNCLNILLIDEPDSHIHSNLQSALIDELRTDINNQHFIITHNDRLINKAEEGELLFINKVSLEKGKIIPIPKENYNNVTAELASKMFSLNEIERNKIIVITEGKTDKKILEIAWSKLNPDIACPFKFISSGIQIDENTRTGNADSVRRTIETLSTFFSDLKIIGLFDNDREGYEQFNSLNKEIFTPQDYNSIHRKHLEKNIFGVVLPVPIFRQQYININSMKQRYFVIEHYFSDEILQQHNMIDEPIINGVSIYEISGKKNNFSQHIQDLDVNEFGNFSILFQYIENLF
ncbi:ATP-dependent endonuclease [Mariniflexile ostreae]|uniref:ATP-dependent endonuclease n=1 Tax=Mariniflexile ostreae TaxID=1520892 RepID=A0ABV5FF44_9FLAO